jgi:hypothetical protein
MKKVDVVGIVENMAMVGGPGGEQRYILYTGEMDQVVLESNRILIINGTYWPIFNHRKSLQSTVP